MRMPVRVSDVVEYDLADIGDYIAKHNRRRALSFIREIREAMAEIGENPFLYQLRSELGAETRIRIHGEYLILFRVLQDSVFVDRVIQGARDPSRLR